MEDVYERLALHLDNLPAGFPRTASGVEMRILRRLFTPEQAELTLHLTLLGEEARVVAYRAGIPVAEAARRLEEMDRAGLIYSAQAAGKPVEYSATQFAVGFWEGQVNRLTPELVRDFQEYASEYFNYDLWKRSPQLRTIPVGQSVDAQTEIMGYERAEEIVRGQTSFAVANCICRQEMRVAGHGCAKPEETCMAFGMAADHYVRTGRGRAISREDALNILREAERVGLVLQPTSDRNPVAICACCGCCCGVLRHLKMHPQPATLVSTPFAAVLDADACIGCGACLPRCQMDALREAGEKVALDAGRCIGCGLCVSVCPSGALTLARKPADQQPRLPKDIAQAYIKMGQGRGKMSYAELARMVAQSKLDRLAAPRE